MKLLLYCPKGKSYLYNVLGKYCAFNKLQDFLQDGKQAKIYNGKILAECDFEVEDLRIVEDDPLGAYWYETKTLSENEVLEKSCLTSDEVYEYLGDYNEGYAIHIKNLHIFNEPRELSDYEYTRRVKGEPTLRAVLFEAPKNMQKIIANGTDAILISIQPEDLCKILNKQKTIVIKKNIIK